MLIVITDIQAGGYQLQLATQFSNAGTTLQERRNIISDKILTLHSIHFNNEVMDMQISVSDMSVTLRPASM